MVKMTFEGSDVVKSIDHKTLFVSDLDGTLLNSMKFLSNYTEETLNELIRLGMQFTIATSRSWNSAKKLVSEIHLSVPVIVYNGALICNATNDKLIKINYIPDLVAKDLLRMLFKRKINPIVYSIIGGEQKASWLKNQETNGIRNYISPNPKSSWYRPINNISEHSTSKIYYLIVIGKQTEVENVADELKQVSGIRYLMQPDIYNKDEYWLEIMSADSSKAGGIEFLKKDFNFEKIVCFGDSISDCDMFRYADESYAVSNASDELLKFATQKITSSDDGVAKFLKEYHNI